MAAENRFPNPYNPNFWLITTPGTRIATIDPADFDDAEDLPFVASYFKASAAGILVVDTPESTQERLVVQQGTNVERIQRIYETGSDAITVTIVDQRDPDAS